MAIAIGSAAFVTVVALGFVFLRKRRRTRLRRGAAEANALDGAGKPELPDNPVQPPEMSDERAVYEATGEHGVEMGSGVRERPSELMGSLGTRHEMGVS